MRDTRIDRAIMLLNEAGLALSSPLVDDAMALQEAFNDEIGKPRPVWCPSDVRRTAVAAAQHESERGVAV